tara:strand:- start:240 stop:644 length:405 start_codon:yes stop_codon:yes gene_type:complete
MSEKLISLACGMIFGVGLVISGMTNPEKVIGFLSITHNWDASLIFVMGGAIAIVSPIFYFLRNKKKSYLGYEIIHTKKTIIDNKLIIGSTLFGIGWGLVGLCPGPAIASIAVFNPITIIFLISMATGVLVTKYI